MNATLSAPGVAVRLPGVVVSVLDGEARRRKWVRPSGGLLRGTRIELIREAVLHVYQHGNTPSEEVAS